MSNFKLGQTVVTAGIAAFGENNFDFMAHVCRSLVRHSKCDWGDICKEDWELNDQGLHDEGRLLSVYNHPEHEDWKIWIITEWDRSATTVLFPSEY